MSVLPGNSLHVWLRHVVSAAVIIGGGQLRLACIFVTAASCSGLRRLLLMQMYSSVAMTPD